MREKFDQILRKRVLAVVCVTNTILSLLLCGDKNKYEISNVLESLGRQTETTCVTSNHSPEIAFWVQLLYLCLLTSENKHGTAG